MHNTHSLSFVNNTEFQDIHCHGLLIRNLNQENSPEGLFIKWLTDIKPEGIYLRGLTRNKAQKAHLFLFIPLGLEDSFFTPYLDRNGQLLRGLFKIRFSPLHSALWASYVTVEFGF